jgi:hypothetical protein
LWRSCRGGWCFITTLLKLRFYWFFSSSIFKLWLIFWVFGLV